MEDPPAEGRAAGVGDRDRGRPPCRRPTRAPNTGREPCGRQSMRLFARRLRHLLNRHEAGGL